jgi:hypothetical protein
MQVYRYKNVWPYIDNKNLSVLDGPAFGHLDVLPRSYINFLSQNVNY